MINIYNAFAVHEMVFAFFRALNEGFVPQRPASRPVPFIIMKKEIWADIVGKYHGYYMVSNLGKIKRLAKEIVRNNGRVQTFKEKILSLPHDKYGYIQISLAHEGVVKKSKLHRLVAEAFLGTIPDGYEINHINGVRDDNRLINLEICTRKANQLHSYRVLKRDTELRAKNLQKGVVAFYVKKRKSQKSSAVPMRIYKEFESIAKACVHLGTNHASSISAVCLGKQKTAYGFIWAFKNAQHRVANGGGIPRKRKPLANSVL